MALSILHLLQGFAPSHFDFFNLQRSQALPTRFRACESYESLLGDDIIILGPVCEESTLEKEKRWLAVEDSLAAGDS